MPVSMMWARSVTRSNSALQSRALGKTVVHSENGRLVVIRMADSQKEAAYPLSGDPLPNQATLHLVSRTSFQRMRK